MHYYVFSPKRPHVLRVLRSRDALDELLSHDHGGRDWAADDVVIDGEGRRGSIAYDGTEYEYRAGEERATPEALRDILYAHLPAIGWKRSRVAEAVESVDGPERFEAVVAQFPPREGMGRYAAAVVALLVVAGIVAAVVWVVMRQLASSTPSLPASP